jgi:DNA replication protein DnaC
MTKAAADFAASALSRLRVVGREEQEAIQRDADERTVARGLTLARERFPFGRRFADARFDNFISATPEQRRARDAVADLAQASAERRTSARPWVILSGNPGTGKSHLLAAAYWYLAEHPRLEDIKDTRHAGLPRVHFAGQLFDRTRHAVYGGDRRDDGGPDSIRAALQSGLAAPLVIVDDYGVGMPAITAQSQTHQEITFALFDELYNQLRPLLLATNLPLERPKRGGLRLQDVLGARAWDRCAEMAVVVPFDWPSWRGQSQGEML